MTLEWHAPVRAGDGAPGPRKIRVLYVDYSVGFGGATQSISLVFRGLEGVEKFVLTSQEPRIIPLWYPGATVYRFRTVVNYRSLGRVKAWARRVVRLGLAQVIVQKMVAALDILAGSYELLRILRIVRRHRIDLIHLNNGFTPPEAMLAARVAGIPCIVHLRGFPGWRKAAHSSSYRRVARTIAISNAVATSLGFTSIAPTRITTIYNAVDLDRFEEVAGRRDSERIKWGIGPDDVAMGIFGRVVAWKGQLEFVRAALEAMRTEPHLKAVIVGDESDAARDYFDEIKRTIADSGFAHRFVLTGYQPDVTALYHAMDVVVHASIEPEPFGRVVPEGMAARHAVIASDSGGPREVITPGLDGLLVPPRDVGAMAEAMVALARDPERRRAMGEQGYAKAVERFGIRHIAQEVERIYGEILG